MRSEWYSPLYFDWWLYSDLNKDFGAVELEMFDKGGLPYQTFQVTNSSNLHPHQPTLISLNTAHNVTLVAGNSNSRRMRLKSLSDPIVIMHQSVHKDATESILCGLFSLNWMRILSHNKFVTSKHQSTHSMASSSRMTVRKSATSSKTFSNGVENDNSVPIDYVHGQISWASFPLHFA